MVATAVSKSTPSGTGRIASSAARVLGVSAEDLMSGVGGVDAQVFQAAYAQGTVTARRVRKLHRPVAGMPPGDVLAGGDDFTGRVPAELERQGPRRPSRQGLRQIARAVAQVPAVDGRGVHAHQDVVGTDLGNRRFYVLEHLGPAMFEQADRHHGLFHSHVPSDHYVVHLGLHGAACASPTPLRTCASGPRSRARRSQRETWFPDMPPSGAGSCGRRKVNVAPLPSPADCAVMSPPWARAMPRAMVSPMPLPPAAAGRPG
ncbi:hypothetical protein SVIOM74S_03827 [Streptomyces violarus]